jgi:hypothetical protein
MPHTKAETVRKVAAVAKSGSQPVSVRIHYQLSFADGSRPNSRARRAA